MRDTGSRNGSSRSDKKSRKEIGEKEIYLCKQFYCSQDVAAGLPCRLLKTKKSRVSSRVYDHAEDPQGRDENQRCHRRGFLPVTSARRGRASDDCWNLVAAREL
jgi:hypothetical protein